MQGNSHLVSTKSLALELETRVIQITPMLAKNNSQRAAEGVACVPSQGVLGQAVASADLCF